MITDIHKPRVFARRFLGVLALFSATACASDGSTGPDADPPTITVEGVQDGATYQGAVSITIRLDRGSYQATLNAAAFSSGQTVTQPGAYVLAVTARDGLATVTKEVRFTIAGPPGGVLIVRLINLGPNDSGGGGDAILITDSSSAGRVHALIDAGPGTSATGGDNFVTTRLSALGVDTLQFMLLTHAHGDHYLGMVPILNGKKVRRFFYNGQLRSLTSYQSVISTAQSRADTVTIVRDTIPFLFGRSAVATAFTVIPPLPTNINVDTDDGDLLNDGSLGTSLRRASFEMFFTGDGEVAANNRWRSTFPSYTRNNDVLKVGHHGANNAVFDNGFNGPSTWLDHVAPTYAVISSNGTTHPRINALNQILQKTNRRTLCTSVHGDITIRIASDGTYTVTPEKNAGLDCVPGSGATS